MFNLENLNPSGQPKNALAHRPIDSNKARYGAANGPGGTVGRSPFDTEASVSAITCVRPGKAHNLFGYRFPLRAHWMLLIVLFIGLAVAILLWW